MVDECAEGFPEVFDVRKQYRLAMAAELNPGNLFDHFLKCSYSTRHRNEGVRQFEHLALSFVHIARDDKVVIAPHRMLACDQKFGNDSCHAATVIKNRLGDCAHQADGAATENQPDAIFGENRAEGAGALDEGRIGAGARSAIDANFSDFAAFFDLVHTYGCALRLRHRQGDLAKIHDEATVLGRKGANRPETAYMNSLNE